MPKPESKLPRALVWHRRDLRLDDNVALAACVEEGFEPVGAFIFDTAILEPLPRSDRRVEFLWGCVQELAASYANLGLDFHVLEGAPETELPRAAVACGANHAFAGRDYEASAKMRDAKTGANLARVGCELSLLKEHVVFEDHEILTGAGGAFSVFTPYKAAWLRRFELAPPTLGTPAARVKAWRLASRLPDRMPTLSELGFQPTNLHALGLKPGESGAKRAAKAFAGQLGAYHEQRDLPGTRGTSGLGPHLRFGTVSPRRLALWAHSVSGDGAATWLSELIWREFYSGLLDRRPDLCDGASFSPRCDALAWGNDPQRLSAWREGRTGIPFVDAGMRELLATGTMHNRARMVAASYLVKHLDCDWRLGEAHFARWLLDFDLASNNGGWQWSASTGCDAQPYFRVFNPAAQMARFDPDGVYVKRWVPELAACPPKALTDPTAFEKQLAAAGVVLGQDYPRPLVEHKAARAAAISKFASLA